MQAYPADVAEMLADTKIRRTLPESKTTRKNQALDKILTQDSRCRGLTN
jgi:hypothetical protein